MLKGKKCPRAGLRVKAEVNPVSAMLYSPGHGPTPGATGTVTKLGRKTCMPGPGGGLVYVDWDDGRTFGVSRHDLAKSKGKAVVMQAAPAVYGLGGVNDGIPAGTYRGLRLFSMSAYTTPYYYAEGKAQQKLGPLYHFRSIHALKKHVDKVLGGETHLEGIGHDPLHNEQVLKNYGKCLRKCKRKPHVGPCIDACLADQPVPSGEALGTIPGRYGFPAGEEPDKLRAYEECASQYKMTDGGQSIRACVETKTGEDFSGLSGTAKEHGGLYVAEAHEAKNFANDAAAHVDGGRCGRAFNELSLAFERLGRARANMQWGEQRAGKVTPELENGAREKIRSATMHFKKNCMTNSDF